MLTNKIYRITLIIFLGGWCFICSVLGLRTCQDGQCLRSYKTLDKRLETTVTQCPRIERDSSNNNDQERLISSTSKETTSLHTEDIREVEFGKSLQEGAPWLPDLMNHPEDFPGFRIVPAETDWCKEDFFSGTKLQILGDIKLGQTETPPTIIRVGLPNFSLHTNGSLTRISLNGAQEHFESTEFCVIPLSNGDFRFKRCVPPPPHVPCPRWKTCIHKCCPEGEVLAVTNEGAMKCLPSKVSWSPRFYKNVNELPYPYLLSAYESSFELIFGRPTCSTGEETVVLSDYDNKFPRLLLNRTLLLLTFRSPWNFTLPKITAIKPTKFCIDGIGSLQHGASNESTKETAAYSGSEWAQVVIGCSSPKIDDSAIISKVFQMILDFFRNFVIFFGI